MSSAIAATTSQATLVRRSRIPPPITLLVIVFQQLFIVGLPSIEASAFATSNSSSLRIIGGIEANELRYPYAVSLSHYPDNPHFCGGSFIAPDVVLSAAHCSCIFSYGDSSSCDITVGRNNISSPFYGNGETIFFEKEIVHPEFDPLSILPGSGIVSDHDFNLIFLKDTISDNTVFSNMLYLRINDDASIPQTGEELTIVGWGDTIKDVTLNATSPVLLEATEYAITNSVCEQSTGKVQDLIYMTYEGKITDYMLCAQGVGTGSCQGDSGGPLIKKGSDESGADDLLVGVVSWGYGCGEEDFPGVYARVSAQYEWIQSNVCTFSKSPPDWFNCEDAAPASLPPVSSPSPQPKEGMTNLLIQVTLDSYPMETGWRLSTLSEEEGVEEIVIVDMPVGSYVETDVNQTYQYEMMVDSEQFYNMTVYDSMADAFEGSVIVVDATTPELILLMHEPGFTSSTYMSQAFYPGYSLEPFLTLSIVFDGYPEEFAFMISNEDDAISFALVNYGSFDNSTSTIQLYIPIYGPSKGDQAYNLVLWDSGGDGICCQYGTGSFELYLGDPDSGGTLLINGDGDYADEGIYPFTVTVDSLTTDSPTTPSIQPEVLVPCTFCEGKTVLDDVIIPATNGLTCEFAGFSAAQFDISSDECVGFALAELACCPDDDVTPSPASTPLSTSDKSSPTVSPVSSSTISAMCSASLVAYLTAIATVAYFGMI